MPNHTQQLRKRERQRDRHRERQRRDRHRQTDRQTEKWLLLSGCSETNKRTIKHNLLADAAGKPLLCERQQWRHTFNLVDRKDFSQEVIFPMQFVI